MNIGKNQQCRIYYQRERLQLSTKTWTKITLFVPQKCPRFRIQASTYLLTEITSHGTYKRRQMSTST